MNWEEELKTLIRARYPIIWLTSSEEQRVIQKLSEITTDLEKTFYVWSATKGIQKLTADLEDVDPGAVSIDSSLMAFTELINQEKAVMLMKDIHPFIQEPLTIRMFKDIYFELKNSYSTLILLAPITDIPIDLQKYVTVIDIPLPEKEELRKILEVMVKDVNEALNLNIELNGNTDTILNAGLGLTLDEFENVLAKSIVAKRNLDPSTIITEKEQIIKKTGILEYYHSMESMEDIGGLENLKSWLMRRKKAFSREAREFGLRPPKGILMVGAPGTGKSLTAKATAKLFGMPLLKLDMSKVFGSLVGESEKNMAEALKIAESIAPCILFVDEIEKAFAGISSSGETDSGVTARVIGQLLTWMQERQKPVFVVATCNDPFKLPPEMTRAGRFDDIFHVDLPSRSEREEIFRIHLNKIGRDPGNFDISEFARLTEGYSGAEIEQIITEALYRAFDEGLELDNQHIIEEIQGYMPLSKKRKDEIERIRKWAEIYCKPASIRDSESGSKARRIEL